MHDDNDRNNLEFLLSLKTQKQWDDWADSCSQDDFEYASDLIKTELSRLELMKLEHLDNVESVTESKSILSNIFK
jgi:hypothetical protein